MSIYSYSTHTHLRFDTKDFKPECKYIKVRTEYKTEADSFFKLVSRKQ